MKNAPQKGFFIYFGKFSESFDENILKQQLILLFIFMCKPHIWGSFYSWVMEEMNDFQNLIQVLVSATSTDSRKSVWIYVREIVGSRWKCLKKWVFETGWKSCKMKILMMLYLQKLHVYKNPCFQEMQDNQIKTAWKCDFFWFWGKLYHYKLLKRFREEC